MLSLRLHPTVRLGRMPGAEGVVLTDGALNRRLDLGPIDDLLPLLDGRPVDDPAVQALDARGQGVLRTLLLLHAFEDTSRELRARAADLTQVAETVRTLPDQRFACAGSGSCCHGLALGPLSVADVERVAALDLEGAGLPTSFAQQVPGPGGRPVLFLRTRETGGCVFLEGNRCGLHARFGPEVKPACCRMFPISAHAELDGVRAWDDGQCGKNALTSSSGPLLADEAPALLEALRPPLALYHPLVRIAPGVVCDFAWFAPTRDALVARLAPDDACADPGRALLDLTGIVERWRRRMLRLPLDAAAAAGDTDTSDTPDDVSADPDALRALAAACRDVLAPLARAPRPPPLTDAVVGALDAIAEGRPVPAGDPAEPALLRRAWRARLFGNGCLVEGRPHTALARMALAWLVTRHAGGARWDVGNVVAARRLETPYPPLLQAMLPFDGSARGIVAAAAAQAGA